MRFSSGYTLTTMNDHRIPRATMRHFFSRLCLLAAFLCLSACQPGDGQPDWFGTDISGADFGQDFSLTDHNGHTRSLADFRGKVVALFFGFTHCPDICPTTLSDLAAAMKLLGARSDDVQVLFVSVDPERDTPEVLKAYVPHFDARFLGLTGTPEQIAATAETFKVFYARQNEAGGGDYTMDHSAGTYVFDRQGKLRIYLRYGQKPAEIAHDLGRLLR